MMLQCLCVALVVFVSAEARSPLYVTPTKPNSSAVCDATKNEMYSNCPTVCDNTCDEKLRMCNMFRRCGGRRCQCPAGHVRNRNEECIPAGECNRYCDASLNEVYNSCHIGCDPTCENPNLFCMTLARCTPRCGCRLGQFRNADNVCVTQNKCPNILLP